MCYNPRYCLTDIARLHRWERQGEANVRKANTWDRVEEIVTEVNRSGTAGVSLIGPDGATWHYLGDRLLIRRAR